MILINPNVELLTQDVGNDAYYHHIATCARLCYAAEKGNDEALINRLNKNKHYSMFRHGTRYYKIPYRDVSIAIINSINNDIFAHHVYYGDNLYLALNGQYILEHPFIMNNIGMYEIDTIEAANIPVILNEIYRYTFIVTTQISTSRELNRVSPNNIAEQSTRYCNFSKNKFGNQIIICKPHWYDGASAAHKMMAIHDWKCEEDAYFRFLKTGFLPQDAREFLPLATATKCAYTYTIKEWCHILGLRYYELTGVAHPNAKIIATMIRNILSNTYNVDELMIKFGNNIN